jgi:Secretion system C-terminal sorting domain
LYNLYGKKVNTYQAKQGNQQLNITGLAAGKYVLQLQTNAGEYYQQKVRVF